MDNFYLLIDGRLQAGDSTLDVINPATEAVFARSPRASRAQLDSAVAAAKRSFIAWSQVPIATRREKLGQVADIVMANVEPLARLLTLEQGKPLKQSQNEVQRLAGFWRYYSTLDLADKVIEDSRDRKVEVRRKPLGVVAVIVPWNFPLILIG